MASSAISPISRQPASFNEQDQDVRRHRKAASTGGGRAWSDEEESYLVEARQHKMPYKHIAAHLKKTELACRLHFHQISFGNKRRRHPTSPSPSRSSQSPAPRPSENRHDSPQRRLPKVARAQSPERDDPPPTYANHSSSGSAISLCNTHVPILPKPPQQVNATSTNLHLFTQNLPNQLKTMAIDRDRLTRVYEAHRAHFWSMVANDYGHNASPAELEEAWFRLVGTPQSTFPPTPSGSPPDSRKTTPNNRDSVFDTPSEPPASQGFNAVNQFHGITPAAPYSAITDKGSVAISSLLTEDKEVRSSRSRSPSRERRHENGEMAL